MPCICPNISDTWIRDGTRWLIQLKETSDYKLHRTLVIRITQGRFSFSPQQLTNIHMMHSCIEDSNGQFYNFMNAAQPRSVQMASTMQNDAQAWTYTTIRASGDPLELSKWLYQILHQIFTPNGSPVPLARRKTHQSVTTIPDTQCSSLLAPLDQIYH